MPLSNADSSVDFVRSIAVVDGDLAVRESFSVLLEGAGYAVTAYASGLQLLQDIPLKLYDCLLIEVDLPDIDGRQLLRKLQSIKVDLPTILMASHRRALRDGVDIVPNVSTLLKKPVTDTCLFEALDRVLVSSRIAHR